MWGRVNPTGSLEPPEDPELLILPKGGVKRDAGGPVGTAQQTSSSQGPGSRCKLRPDRPKGETPLVRICVQMSPRCWEKTFFLPEYLLLSMLSRGRVLG